MLTAAENEAEYDRNKNLGERVAVALHCVAAALFAVAGVAAGNAKQHERRKLVRLPKHGGGTCYVDPGNVSGLDESLGTVRLQTYDGINYGAIAGTADEVVQALGMVYEDGTTSKVGTASSKVAS